MTDVWFLLSAGSGWPVVHSQDSYIRSYSTASLFPDRRQERSGPPQTSHIKAGSPASVHISCDSRVVPQYLNTVERYTNTDVSSNSPGYDLQQHQCTQMGLQRGRVSANTAVPPQCVPHPDSVYPSPKQHQSTG